MVSYYNFTMKRHISKVNIFLEFFLKYLRLQLQKQITKHFATYCLSPLNFATLAPCSTLNNLILSPVSWNRPHISDLFPLYWLHLLLWLWISISLAQEGRWGHDWCQKRLSSSLPSVSWSDLLSGILVKATAPFVARYAHTEHAHIILWKKRSVTALHCVLGHLSSLVLGSFTVAFLVKNIPDLQWRQGPDLQHAGVLQGLGNIPSCQLQLQVKAVSSRPLVHVCWYVLFPEMPHCFAKTW